MWPQHAKRRRVIADRYANSNVMRPDSMSGIRERAARFVARCEASVGQSLDIFVSPLISLSIPNEGEANSGVPDVYAPRDRHP